jgi:hypothetical protein
LTLGSQIGSKVSESFATLVLGILDDFCFLLEREESILGNLPAFASEEKFPVHTI